MFYPNRLHFLLVFVLSTTAMLHAQWQPGPALPSGAASRNAPVAVLWQGKIHLMGGGPVDAAGDSPVQILNTAGTSWSTSTALENDFRHHGAAVDSLGRMIIWYGIDSGGGEGDSFEWNAADGDAGGIEQPDSQAFQLFAHAVDNLGRIYTIGGSTSSTAGSATPVSGDVERYDGASDSWTTRASMSTPVSDASAVYDGQGHILVFGGVTAAGSRTANVAQYDIAGNSWSDTAVPDMPAARSGLRATMGADGRIYAIGGSDGSPTRTTFILDLLTNTWSLGPDLATARERFGCATDVDGNIWACGGSTTGTTEILFTPTLPSVTRHPMATDAYLDAPSGIDVAVDGTAPFTYQWRKDGQAIFDGPTGHGSTIVGAQSASLAFMKTRYEDIGNYDCIITNAAGSVISNTALLTIKIGAGMPTDFQATSLHPSGHLASSATAVDGSLIGGTTSYVHSNPLWGTISRPVVWNGTGGVMQDLTPANSVGGGIRAGANGSFVGWWWWPYTNQYGTGYNQHACIWTGPSLTHVEAQRSGWEFGSLSDTDGQHHVGTLRYDESSTNSHGAYYTSNSTASYGLTNSPDWGSSANAIDGIFEFGQVHIGYGVVHASRWEGANSQWTDMNPAGSTWSYITGAGDGQQVGRVTIGGVNEAALWAGSAASFVTLDPGGTTNASLRDCEGGFQVGTAFLNGVSSAAIWRGTPESVVNLHSYLPPGYSSSSASAIDVDATGFITVAGSAVETASGKSRAFVWQGQGPTFWQDTSTVSASAGGVFHMIADLDSSKAYQVFIIVGTTSGTSPGVFIGNNQLLPLNPDWYTDQTILYPNGWIFPSFAYLDGNGSTVATATLPAGALYVVYPVTIHHALVVLSADGTGFDHISNAVPLTITP